MTTQSTADYVQVLLDDKYVTCVSITGGYARANIPHNDHIYFPPGALSDARYDINTGALTKGKFTFPDGSVLNFKRR